MLLSSLLLIPIIGVFVILINKDNEVTSNNIKFIALTATILNLFLSLIIFILFDFSTNQFQFVQEYHEISYFDFYLGIDGLSIYFILLTTIIMPIALLSNWTSISKDVESYVIIILLLETLLLAVFLVLDILLFYIFFESILPPLFILIGIYGSDNRVKASFYLFLYTLLGSLFLLLSILAMSSIMSTTDFDTLFKGNFIYSTQLFLFYGIFIAFAVKTPTIFLNTWLLKAHVESPLGGSIILAAIVLKLSLYGILRLILPVLPKAYMEYTYIIYLIGVITIIYASLSTLRTIDVKELIAYSSVSHAAVYLLAVFSNNIQGIEGGINLGLAHGLVSPGLFICAGGVLYDRSHTRLISFYRGMAQVMPLFAILFFILCLANCGAPLTLNFVGEFMSLYGVFERSSLFGVFASSSIVFSAAYTIYMYQRISFGGSYSRMFAVNIIDLNKREFMILLSLVVPTVVFGVYTAPILDGIHYSVSTLIYSFDFSIISCDAPKSWVTLFNDSYNLSGSYMSYQVLLSVFFWIMLFGCLVKYFDHVKSFLYKIGCKLNLLASIISVIPLPYLFIIAFYTFFAVNYILVLFDMLHHIYMLLPFIENPFIYGGVENHDLMVMGNTGFETASKKESVAFLTTPTNSGTSGTGDTGGNTGTSGTSVTGGNSGTSGTGVTGGNSGTSGTGVIGGSSTTGTGGTGRGLRTDNIGGVDFSNEPSVMDTRVSTDPCPGNNHKPHLWLRLNESGLQQYNFSSAGHPGNCDLCHKLIPFAYYDCTSCGVRICNSCSLPPCRRMY